MGREVEPNWFSALATLPAANSNTNTSMKTYTTSDFYLSAFLVASGTPLVSHDRTNGRTSFEFAQKDGLSQLIDEYYADRVKVSPIRYGNSLKNLKALIYSGKPNTNTHGTHEFIHSTGVTK
jgi:hypothetical protein